MKIINDIRHATWLELFFDLIFVVAIAKTTHVLQHLHNGHIETITYFKYVLIMIPVWWAWVGTTMFANRYNHDDVLQRVMILGQMFFIIIMAAHINTDFDSYYKGFLFSYAAIRFLTVMMYGLTSLYEPKTRHISSFLALTFGTGILISLSSLFFDGLTRYLVLYAGIGFDIVMPLLSKKRLESVPVNAHHLPERFGLLTIILLGESIVSLASSFNALNLTALSLALAGCGFVIACGVWWLYFENIERRIAGQHLGHGHGIIYSHLLVYTGLGGIAAMIRFAVIPELILYDYKLLSGLSMLTFILALQFLQFIYQPKKLRTQLLRNAAVFNGLFILLLLLAPSITVIIVGTMILTVGYVILDSLILDTVS